jgi:hypothetical protein
MIDLDFDIEESGCRTAFLDSFVADGIPAGERRRFAGWLEAQLERLIGAREQLKQDFSAYCDENPVPQTILPEAATFYLPNREAAQARVELLRADPRIADTAIQLEPDNGWVVVLIPAPADLSDLVGVAEIQDGRKNPTPVGKRRAVSPKPAPDKPLKAQAAGEGQAQAPSKGVTARVWEIAAGIPSGDRAKIIAACVAEGINASTAATQYSKWKKAQS